MQLFSFLRLLTTSLGYLNSTNLQHINNYLLHNKYVGEGGTQLLFEIYNNAWKQEKIPKEREMDLILLIFKKGKQ